MTKQCKRHGKVYPASPTQYSVECTGVSKSGYNGITVFKDERDGTTVQGTSFVVGDTAEYGSYNLSYTGDIVKISDKCVTIVAWPGTRNAQIHRLSMNEFCWRNHTFNAEKTAARNAEEMMYI